MCGLLNTTVLRSMSVCFNCFQFLQEDRLIFKVLFYKFLNRFQPVPDAYFLCLDTLEWTKITISVNPSDICIKWNAPVIQVYSLIFIKNIIDITTLIFFNRWVIALLHLLRRDQERDM